jgi:predicted nucleic acid-binding protein
LISLYSNDPNTNRARAFAARLKRPITISSLNQFELEQAINFLVWRKTLPSAESNQIKMALASDCTSSWIVVAPCNFARVLARARSLSAKHTATAGHRSMDILQVAAALELGADHFLSFDVNQRKLAKVEGLKLNP